MATAKAEESVVNANEPSSCSADEEIPAYTVTNLTENKIKQINIEKYAAKRIIKLFVRHLLDTEMVRNHDKLEKHFVIKNMAFRTVMIKGVIVGVQFLTFKTKNRTLISVDDGTGVMDCYVEENKFLEGTRSEVQKLMQDSTGSFKLSQSDNSTLKATLMMIQSTRVRLDKLPHYRNFKLGDSIRLIGTLTEYDGKRSCFVTSIINDDDADKVDYQEHVENLYEKMYL